MYKKSLLLFFRPTKPKKHLEQTRLGQMRLVSHFLGFAHYTQKECFCKTENEEQVFYPKHE